jgi:acyl carrier protein
MTPNGKLDRAALPSARRLPAAPPPPEPPAGHPARPAPVGSTEQQVAEVLAAVLERDGIGLHDDFFALGGDSLRAVQAILWLNSALGTQVPISVLFEARTVYGLARLLDGDGPADPQLRPRPAGQPPRLSAAQWRLWLHQQIEPGSVQYNRSLAVRIPEPLSPEAVQAALAETLARHDTLRTCYRADESGSPVPVAEPAAAVPLIVEDGDPQAVLARELSRPFDLTAHPPVRARAVRQDPGQCFLLLVVHEIAADASSRALIVRQLRSAFRGRPVTAPALRYADYAAWQRELAAGPTAQRHLDFWRAALAGLDLAGLRTDRPRPARRDGRSATVSFIVPPGVAGGISEAAFSYGAPLAIGLLTALFGVLARYTTGTDLTVGVTVDGRAQPELEHLVGTFENVAVFRVSLDGARTFAQLLGRVREAGIGALGHAVPPLEDVVAATVEVTGPAWPGRNPLFDVSFALHPATGLSDLPLPDAPGAGSDLHCDLTEQPDGGLCGRIEYATALFDEVTAVRLASDYVRLLGLASARPDLALTELPSAAEAVSPT